MAFDTYYANVGALCEKRGIANPIREEDLKVAALVFWTPYNAYTKILGNEMNRASRLFLEEHAANLGDPFGEQHLIRGPEFADLKEKARAYFGELWELDRPLISALREGDSVILFWKPFDAERFERLAYG